MSSISLSMSRLAKRLYGHVLRVFDSNGIDNRFVDYYVAINIAYTSVNR